MQSLSRGQHADLASDWLFTLVQPIRSQLDTSLDNMTITHKFPSLNAGKVEGGGGRVPQVPGERLAQAVGGTKVPEKSPISPRNYRFV